MSFDEQEFETTIRDGDIVKFEKFCNEDLQGVRLRLEDKHYFTVATFGHLCILNRVLDIPQSEEFICNPDTFDTFFSTACLNASPDFIRRLLEIDTFVTILKMKADKYLPALGGNVHEHMVDLLPEIIWCITRDIFKQNAIQMWLSANAVANSSMSCKLLEFPYVFEMVVSQDPFRFSGPSFISHQFIPKYMQSLQLRKREFISSNQHDNPTFDVGDEEGDLGVLILGRLLDTYPRRKEIQRHIKQLSNTTRHPLRKSSKNTIAFSFNSRCTSAASCTKGSDKFLEWIQLLESIPTIKRKTSLKQTQTLKMVAS